jgi:soluble lytic murein transglycosylase
MSAHQTTSRSIASAWRGCARAAALLLAVFASSGQDPARAADRAGPLDAHALTSWQRAFEAVEAADWPYALDLARRAGNPTLEAVVRGLDLARDGSDADFGEITLFLHDRPGWPGLARIRWRAEQVMPADLAPDAVIAWFDEEVPVSLEGVIRLARALEAVGRGEEARALVRDAWPTLETTAAGEERFLSAFGEWLTRPDHIRRTDALLWADRGAEARRSARRAGEGWPALAEARIRLADGEHGVDWAIRAVPEGLQGDEGLLYERTRWRRRADMTAEAIEMLARQPAGSDHADRWWTERHILARQLFNEGDAAAAYRLVTAHQEPEGLALAESEFLAGWLALRFLGRPADARAHFTRLVDNVRTPISQARGAYWLGRAHEALGEDEEAARRFAEAARHPATYYGQLALQRLGQPMAEGTAVAAEDGARAFAADERVAAARMLHQLGMDDLADAFIDALADSPDPGVRALTAGLALELDRPERAVRAGKAATAVGAPPVDAAYPVIELPRLPAGLDPALVLAIIRQESEFRTDALSSAGARGLMQLMPRTAAAVARRLRLTHSPRRLAEPDYNLRLGTAYLADAISRYGGSTVLALAAYNAGSGRLSGWLEELGDPRRADVDTIDWIERIPIAETRNYIPRGIESAGVYRRRLGRADFALLP